MIDAHASLPGLNEQCAANPTPRSVACTTINAVAPIWSPGKRLQTGNDKEGTRVDTETPKDEPDASKYAVPGMIDR